MLSPLTSAPACVAVQLMMTGLLIGLTVDISAAVTVDICSEGRTRVASGSVTISSPGYPDLHQIRNDVICSCYLTTQPNSNDEIRIQPTSVYFTRSRDTCYSSIDIWNSADRMDKNFCLNSPFQNFSSNLQFRSVFLTNFTYQAFRPNSLSTYQGRFLITVTASRANNLWLACTSFPSTSTMTTPTVVRGTSRSTSTTRSTNSNTTPSSSAAPSSSITPSKSTTPRSSTTLFSSIIPSSSTTSYSSTIPSSSTTSASTTIPSSSTTSASTTIPSSSTTSASTTIPSSSTTFPSSTPLITNTNPVSSAPIRSTTLVSSTTSTRNPILKSSVFPHIRTTITSATTTSSIRSSTMDVNTNSIRPELDASSSATVIAQPLTNNGNIAWIVIGVILPIVLIALVAATVIACRVRKSKKHSANGNMSGAYRGRNSCVPLLTALNNSYELQLRVAGCNAASSEQSGPSTSRQRNGLLSSYTPMDQSGPRMTSKTSLSSNVYEDLDEIQNHHDSAYGGSADTPSVRSDTGDRVYYNTDTDAASARLARRSEINAYETCYSPEIEGVTSLNFGVSNSPMNGVYTSIDECAIDVSDKPTGSRERNVNDQNEGCSYCNVDGQRGNDAMPRKATNAEVMLVENQLYSSKLL